ncbi:MAG: molybdopterin molybdotransferase MoeA [Planctomycetota bacterium]|nr:molybdopterin molybdotransferase MoeA [Planctomycetota bacterium]
MITVEKALEIIRENLPEPQFETVGLSDASGRVIAEDVLSDIDMPPFDKSAMDGYAVRSEDIKLPPVELEVLEIVPAGKTPVKEVKPGKAIKIMTGAPVPSGADAVIMVEDTQYEPATRTVRVFKGVKKHVNICFKAEDLKEGDKVVNSDTKLTPQHIGLLAAVGKSRLRAYKYPSITIATTGDELVEITQLRCKMGTAEIRNSNTYSLMAQLNKVGFKPVSLGIIRDDMETLTEKISEGLKGGGADILILTGGVSMGDYDIVEDVLKKLKVDILFNKVAIKPGKPFVFGRASRGGGAGGLIFSLPGNPVSCFVITEVFIKAALSILCADKTIKNQIVQAVLKKPITNTSNRQQYIPARLWETERGQKADRDALWMVEPLASHGSADIVSICRANAFIIVPPDSAPLEAGAVVNTMRLPE